MRGLCYTDELRGAVYGPLACPRGPGQRHSLPRPSWGIETSLCIAIFTRGGQGPIRSFRQTSHIGGLEPGRLFRFLLFDRYPQLAALAA